MIEPILTKRDLEEALSKDRALIFLWVNYAIQARHAEVALRALLESWREAYPDCQLSAYRVDISEPAGEIWDALREWLQSEKRLDQITDSGSLLWVKSGKVALCARSLIQFEQSKILAVTQCVFGPET
jgi:hypothetical protein